jgi:hypothetical protein
MVTKRLMVTMLIAVALLTVGGLLGQRAMAGPQSQASTSSGSQQPSMMPDMMKMHQQMMADMKADNAKLADLAKQMNAAPGDAKLDATVAVVNELVRQHQAMVDHMSKMSEHMMGRMMKK